MKTNIRTEFYGLPGCGKTYLVEKIKGVSRVELTQKATNKYLLLIKGLSRFSPISLWYKFKLRQILSTSNKVYKYHDTKWDDMLNSIVLVASAYRMGINHHRILDEGIVQRIISLGINYNLETKTIIKMIESFHGILEMTEVVWVEISSEEAFKSIKERNRKESKMDFFSDEKLLDYLREYGDVCEEVAGYFKFKKLHRRDFENYIRERKKDDCICYITLSGIR